MINQTTLTHLLRSTLETLGAIRDLNTDGKLHVFAGANSATTGYYRITEDGKESSFTVDYFHGNIESSATLTFLIESTEAKPCH